jgi:hypothetical protein
MARGAGGDGVLAPFECQLESREENNMYLTEEDALDLVVTGCVLNTENLIKEAIWRATMDAKTRHGSLNNKYSTTNVMRFVKQMYSKTLPKGVTDKVKAYMEKEKDKSKDRFYSYRPNNPHMPKRPVVEGEPDRVDLQTPDTLPKLIGYNKTWARYMILEIEKLYYKAGLKPPLIEIRMWTGTWYTRDKESIEIQNKEDGSILISTAFENEDRWTRTYMLGGRLGISSYSQWNLAMFFDLKVATKKGKKTATLGVVSPKRRGRLVYTGSIGSAYFAHYENHRDTFAGFKNVNTKMHFRGNYYRQETEEYFIHDRYAEGMIHKNKIPRVSHTFSNRRGG